MFAFAIRSGVDTLNEKLWRRGLCTRCHTFTQQTNTYPLHSIFHFYYLLKVYVYFIRFPPNDRLSALESTSLHAVNAQKDSGNYYILNNDIYIHICLHLSSFIWTYYLYGSVWIITIGLLWIQLFTAYNKLIMIKTWFRIKHNLFLNKQTRTPPSHRAASVIAKKGHYTQWSNFPADVDSVAIEVYSSIENEYLKQFSDFKFTRATKSRCVYLIIK